MPSHAVDVLTVYLATPAGEDCTEAERRTLTAMRLDGQPTEALYRDVHAILKRGRVSSEVTKPT